MKKLTKDILYWLSLIVLSLFIMAVLFVSAAFVGGYSLTKIEQKSYCGRETDYITETWLVVEPAFSWDPYPTKIYAIKWDNPVTCYPEPM